MGIQKRNKLALCILILMVFIIGYSTVRGQEIETEIISNFDVFGADIRDIFRSLAELGGLNILIDPQVSGLVTIKLKHGLTIKETIELLAQTYGYSYRWINKSRTVIVGNEKTFANFEVKETRIYRLNYAKPDELANTLKVIILPEKIGIDIRTNQLTINASILEHQNIAETILRLDREMPQLNIEARMEEITSSATKELGIMWDFSPTSSTANFNITTIATLKALEETNKARLLANPNISITDSQEGKILIGDKFPIITADHTAAGIEYKVQYVEVGTKLIVIPRINENDIVTITVKAEVSNIIEWKKTGSGDDVPVIRTREASTVIRLREGETFIISGLHKETNSVSNSGMPGLSKVPLVGRLFGNKKDGPNEQTEIVIFLTPKIIRLKNEEIDTSNVHTIGKQPSSELEVPKTVPVPVPTTPIINTPTVQEGTTKQNSNDSVEPLKKTSENAPTATTENVKPKTTKMPLQEEPVDKEIPVEEKELPDLSKLPKALDSSDKVVTPVTPLPPTASDQTPLRQVEAVKVKVKAKKSETVASLAKKYGIDKESIVAENKLSGTQLLATGTELVLTIPKSHFYEIKPKETLWRIAKRYGTTVELLMEINNITDHTKVEKGQAILLPVAIDKIANSKF